MNKSDLILITIVFVISVILIVILMNNSSSGNYAFVYYENKIIKKIDLSKNDIYKVDGYNGEVVIEVKNHKIGVINETSPYHLCSKQGFVSSSLEPIVCLPNKIVIKIEEENTELDAVVR